MSQNKMFKRPDIERRWIENWVFVKDPGDDTPPDPTDDPPDDPPGDPPDDPPTDGGSLEGIYITIPVMDGVIPTDFNYGVIPDGYIPKSIYVPNPTLQDPFGGYWLHWWQPP